MREGKGRGGEVGKERRRGGTCEWIVTQKDNVEQQARVQRRGYTRASPSCFPGPFSRQSLCRPKIAPLTPFRLCPSPSSIPWVRSCWSVGLDLHPSTSGEGQRKRFLLLAVLFWKIYFSRRSWLNGWSYNTETDLHSSASLELPIPSLFCILTPSGRDTRQEEEAMNSFQKA